MFLLLFLVMIGTFHGANGFVVVPARAFQSLAKGSEATSSTSLHAETTAVPKTKKKGRKILFITTDMMRWDALGYYGDPYAKTPNLDKLAAEGIRYDAARNENPLCMPCRNSMVTGQYPRTHGSWNNGIPLPHDTTTIAHVLHDEAGYRTAIIGKGHWEPFRSVRFLYFVILHCSGLFRIAPVPDLTPLRSPRSFTFLCFFFFSSPISLESNLGMQNSYGPIRGFEFAKLQAHGSVPFNSHYNIWLRQNHPEYVKEYYQLLNLAGDHSVMNQVGGGETGAVFVKDNKMPREIYQTDWLTDNAIRHIDSLDNEEDWFVWVSYGDPHHAYDPPSSEDYLSWKDIAPYEKFGKSDEQRMEWLKQKPWHWQPWYTGEKFVSFEALEGYSYQGDLKEEHIREIHQKIYTSNKLIDDGIGKIMDHLNEKGILEDTDIFFTPDHGGMDGAMGLLLIGPSMTDQLCRLPMIWKPAASQKVPAAMVNKPVGAIDLAPTFCKIAGIDVPEWMDGKPLPTSDKEAEEQKRVILQIFCVHRRGCRRYQNSRVLSYT